jgi:hypothetical protein
MNEELIPWLHSNSAFRFNSSPESDTAIAALESEFRILLPDGHREVLRTSGGGSLEGALDALDLYGIDRLREMNRDHEIRWSLPGMFVFGENWGGALYYYDVLGRLERGSMAIFWVEMGSVGFPFSRFVGNSVREVCEKISCGASFFELPHMNR